MKDNTRVSRWLQRLGYLVFFFVVVEMVVLIQQNRDLKSKLSAASSNAIQFLKSGDIAPPFRLSSLDGNRTYVNIGHTGRPILLYIFSTTCPHCKRNIPIWKQITRKLDTGTGHKNAMQVIGVSIDDVAETRAYCSRNSLNYTTLVADTTFDRVYEVNAVPQTIFILANGKIADNWIGQLNNKDVKKLIEAIGLEKGPA